MDDVLYQIFCGTYDPTPKAAAPDQAMPEDLLKLYQQMERTLGLEFVDRWDSLQGKREEWRGIWRRGKSGKVSPVSTVSRVWSRWKRFGRSNHPWKPWKPWKPGV